MNKTGERQNFLDIVFSRSTEFEWAADTDGIVTIFIQNKGFWNKFAQKFLHKAAVSKLTLDTVGSFIWLNIDGARDVYSIGQSVKKQFKQAAEPLYERLSIFMKQLERNGLTERKN